VPPSSRRQLINQRLSSAGEVAFADLAEELGVSEMTIRRDLDRLAREGHARLVRGGAISAISGSYEPPLVMRRATASAAKAAIGVAGAALVRDGDTVILDVGSTALELATSLRGRAGLTVVTASLPVAIELGNEPGITVVVTGGRVRRGELSLAGGMAEEAFSSFNCDLAFIGVGGLRAEPGLTDYNVDDARVKRAAIRSARRTVVLADSSKLGKVTFSTVARLTEIDALVTDAPADHMTVADAARLGVEIITAPALPSAVTAVHVSSQAAHEPPH
jgi:DeoR/GlpR family transcriptional regulator of sugar metabolism